MSKSISILVVCILVLVPIPLKGQQPEGAKVHVLKPTPKTVA